MLIILDSKSRKSGLKDYLKKGKDGRRDEKDIRIKLMGDLEDFDEKIQYLNKNFNYKENYRNIVISFQEDIEEIGEEKLQQIAQDFVRLYMKGYEEEDINVYSEAHIPKKSGGHLHVHISFLAYSHRLQKRLDLGNHKYRLYELQKIKEYLETKYNLKTLNKQKIVDHEKFKENKNYKNYEIKKQILEDLQYFLKNSSNINFNDMLTYLERKHNAKIVRISSKKAKKKYITLQLENGQKIRLRGEIFNKENFKENLKKLKNNELYITNNLNNKKNLKEIEQEIERIQKRRVEYINKRFYKNKNKQKNFWEQKVKYKKDNKNFDKKLYVLTKLLQQDYKKAKKLNVNLQNYFFKEIENVDKNEKELLIANKSKNIYIKVKKNEIISNSNANNVKEQAEKMFQLLLLQNKDPLIVEVEGSLEFKLHFKRLQEQYLQEQINEIKEQKNKTKTKDEITI